VVLVVAIMGILTAIAAQKWGGALEQSRFENTRKEMDRLAVAIAGNAELTANGVRTDFGYVGDVGALPANLDALVTNPGGYSTWNGPYVQNDFTQNPNDYKQDAWGTDYTYSGGVTIVSNGSGSAVTKQFSGAAADLTSNSVAGSITDGFDHSPGDSATAVTVALTYPNGAGSMTTATTNPNAGGSFEFSGSVPVGTHKVEAIYLDDTLTRYVSVLPKSTAVINFRFPGSHWSGIPSGGGGSGLGYLSYVSGSAVLADGVRTVIFYVENLNSLPVVITSITATYAPSQYYKEVHVAGTKIFDNDNPCGGSGDVQPFTAVAVNPAESIEIKYKNFELCASGCGDGDISGVDFTIDFSDGSSIDFTAPTP
jgi:type II secretory pathway pseudopilin PulG